MAKVESSENVQEETKDEVKLAIKPIMSSETDKKIATRRPYLIEDSTQPTNQPIKLDSFTLDSNSNNNHNNSPPPTTTTMQHSPARNNKLRKKPNVIIMPIRDPKAGIPEYQTVKMTPIKTPPQLKLITQNVTGLTDSTPIFFHNSPSLISPAAEDARSDLESLNDDGREMI